MRRLLLLVALLPMLALVACGGSSNHNDADVTFAQGMIPHHEQAVQMADMVMGDQQSEIATMKELLA